MGYTGAVRTSKSSMYMVALSLHSKYRYTLETSSEKLNFTLENVAQSPLLVCACKLL